MRDAFLTERDAHFVRDAGFARDARLRRVCGTHRIAYHSVAASLITSRQRYIIENNLNKTVEGFQYCKSYFYEEDETKLPAKIRVYYNRKNPKIMYREGAVRDGVIISVASIILSTILLFAVVAPYIW